MGNQDAPKAPAGWYPIEAGKPGERYWDGKAWTGETRGLPVLKSETNSQNDSKKRFTKRTIVTISLSAICVFALIVGFALSSKPSTVLVPDVENLTKAEAIEAVENVGLVAVTEEDYSPRGQKAGIAFSSKPGPNASVSPGTKIVILISTGEGPGDDLFSTYEDPFDSGANNGWQPEGYSAFSDELAFMWVDGGPDPCGSISCQYNTINVVSKFGCPSGLYVEVNFLSSGVVVDWSNDTVPALSPGQTAQLQFVTYQGNADSAQVANMSCH
jgi:hypothetical protein